MENLHKGMLCIDKFSFVIQTHFVTFLFTLFQLHIENQATHPQLSRYTPFNLQDILLMEVSINDLTSVDSKLKQFHSLFYWRNQIRVCHYIANNNVNCSFFFRSWSCQKIFRVIFI